MNQNFKLLFLLSLFHFSAMGQNENSEPLTNLDIIVNGEKFHIKDGDTLNVSGNQIIVKSLNYLTFDFGTVRFDYPRYFTFSFEQEFGYKNWTLSGNDLVIMYFEIGA
ncbi:MAG: hypothetical protein C0490_28075, partial [Marivirga sp.]|nr:hypothetical protein [Marivirga sp.]